ncbi:MAG: hypothetical protein C0478_12790 [Planctomyces sp.]|nr:hypothetical protein [Planctomyces sp.]
MASHTQAAEIRLKNGIIVSGKATPIQGLAQMQAKTPGPIPIYPIIMVDAGWQKIFVPTRQIPDAEKTIGQPDLFPWEVFELKHHKTGRQQVLAQIGGFSNVTPFDEFGRRRLEIQTQRGAENVIQGISKLTPKYALIDALTHQWESGMATSSLPPDILSDILRKAIDPTKPKDRLAIVRFYLQGELYAEAQKELDSVAAEFPELADQVARTKTELIQLRGRQFVRQLQERKKQGQHELAEGVARLAPADQLGPVVMRDIEAFLKQYDVAREQIELARFLLGELQAKIMDRPLRDRLALLRSEVSDGLSFETLPRLEAFLRAEKDATLSAEEKLSLAYSGWIFGSVGASTDLAKTLTLWDARHLVVEYLKEEQPTERENLLRKIVSLEGVGWKTVKQLVPQLPPFRSSVDLAALDSAAAEQAGEVDLDGIQTINLRDAEGNPIFGYQAILPPEYDPAHNYPAIVALRPEDRSTADIATWWAGTAERPGYARRRGFIVIAPEYVPAGARKYNGEGVAHLKVLAALADARGRYSIDADRVFLSGHAMGGDAAFDIGMSHADEFAGVIPICGRADTYCKYSKGNAHFTHWYVVAGELDRDMMSANANVLEFMFKEGFKHDLMLVQIHGRGLEMYSDELQGMFEWMELHTRDPAPADIEWTSLRKTDSRGFGLSILDLPRTLIIPHPAGTTLPSPQVVKFRITPGNSVYITSPGKRHVLRLTTEPFNLEERVNITINGNRKFRDFLVPDVRSLLEELRQTGDRSRLADIVLEL